MKKLLTLLMCFVMLSVAAQTIDTPETINVKVCQPTAFDGWQQETIKFRFSGAMLNLNNKYFAAQSGYYSDQSSAHTPQIVFIYYYAGKVVGLLHIPQESNPVLYCFNEEYTQIMFEWCKEKLYNN